MNRSLLVAVVVGLLVVQGSVAGVLVGGPTTAESSNTSDTATTANESVSNATDTAATANATDTAATANATDTAATANATATTADSESTTSSSTTRSETDENATTSETSTAAITPTETATATEPTSETQTQGTTETSTQTATAETTTTGTRTATTAEATTETSTATATDTPTTTESTRTATETPTSTTSSTAEPTTAAEPTTTTQPAAPGPNEAPGSDGESSTSGADDGGDTEAGSPPTAPRPDGAPSEAPPAGTSSAVGTSGSASASAPAAGSDGEAPSAASASRAGAREAPTSGAGGAAPSTGSSPAAGAGPSAAGSAPSGAAGDAPTGGSVPSAASSAPSAAGSTPGAAGASARGAQGASGAGGGASAVSPDADFAVSSVDSDVAVGEPGTVSVTLENTGEDATNAVVNFQSQSGEITFGQSGTTSRFVGDWDEGENKTIDLTVRAAPGADTVEYPVQATISYDDDDGNQSQSAPVTFGVTPDASSPDLSVESVSSDVPVGGTGNVSVTLENTGEDATDAVVNLQTLSPDLLFGRTANTTRFVGDWDEGETRTVTVTMRAARTADTDEYPVRASVSYEDDDGNDARLGPATFGVTPEGRQEFSLSDVSSDLAVGDSGTISGTVTNDGPKNATDAVLTVSPNGTRDVIPRQRQYVLGDLGTNESEAFDLPVFVNATTESGERQVQFFVQYYDTDGTPLRSAPLNAQVDVGESTDDFDILSTETDLEAGGQGTLSVTMENTGEDVTDATVSFQSLSGGVLFGESANATRYVEDWDTGDRRSFEFDVASPAGTGGQRYPMQASVRYTDSDDDPGQSGPFAFGVVPENDTDDFRLVSSASTVPVGDRGPVSLTFQNTGANATEAIVTLQSLSGDIVFGRAPNATAYVGEWPAGAQRTITVNATASNTSDTRSYPLQASISYNDSDGDDARAGPFKLGVTPRPEQEFSVADARSSLRVGDTGNLSVAVTNEGPGSAKSAVVKLVSQSQSLSPQETEVAIGNLGANGTKRVSFPIEVPDSAESGQRQFSFVVEYDNENGDTRRSGRLSVQSEINGERNAFTVERANDTAVDVGGSKTVTINVTNNLDTKVTNLDAKAFVNDPLSVSNSEAYVSQIDPGKTKQITFDVSVSGGANPAEYPLSVDFQYDTPGEDSQLSQTYNVPIETNQSDDGGLLSSLPFVVGLVGLLVVLGIVGLVWSRR